MDIKLKELTFKWFILLTVSISDFFRLERRRHKDGHLFARAGGGGLSFSSQTKGFLWSLSFVVSSVHYGQEKKLKKICFQHVPLQIWLNFLLFEGKLSFRVLAISSRTKDFIECFSFVVSSGYYKQDIKLKTISIQHDPV